MAFPYVNINFTMESDQKIPLKSDISPNALEQTQKSIELLQQQNKILQMEVDTMKLKIKYLEQQNNELREASVAIHAIAEQEEEFISNTLFKQIRALKNEKDLLVEKYEEEDGVATDDLSSKLRQLNYSRGLLEGDIQHQQEDIIKNLVRKIEKLEAEIALKQASLEQVKREKVELENTLEKEQEALVNKLWKKLTKLEAEKRMLQIQLDQPVSETSLFDDVQDNPITTSNVSSHIKVLKSEISKLKGKLVDAEKEHADKMQKYAEEEKCIVEENVKLQRRLQIEIHKREVLTQQLSESESSIEMEEDGKVNLHTHPSSRFVLSTSYTSKLGPQEQSSSGNKIENRCLSCGQAISTSNSTSGSKNSGLPQEAQVMTSENDKSEKIVDEEMPQE